MLHRRLLVALSLLGVFAATFVGTSAALRSGPSPRILANVPAYRLPVTPLTDSEAIAANNVIGTVLGQQAGVTPESFSAARTIGRTSLGSLYLLPGTTGACLVIPSVAATCGDPAGDGVESLSLLLRTSDGAFVGGGIVSDSIRSLVAESSVGARAIPLRNGVFVVTERDDFRSITKVRSND